MSNRFERGLKQLAKKCAGFKDREISSKEKDLVLVELLDARRSRVQ